MSTLLGPRGRRAQTRTHTATEALIALLTGLLLALLVLAWGMAWKGSLAPLWAGALLHQTGVAGYLLLAASCVLGPLIGTPLLGRFLAAPARLGWHGLLSGFALALGAVHGAFSLVGPEHLSLRAALLPDAASLLTLAPFQLAPLQLAPFQLALAAGTVSLWLTLTVYLTWALRRPLGLRVARALHLLAYPAFVAATLHGAWLGRGPEPLYTLPSLLVGLALALRLATPNRRQVGRR